MPDLSSLNPEQRQAVEAYRGPMLILAGAGTGKTRVITYRIAQMLAKGIDASTIVALSFTNKAAREMSERVNALVGKAAKNVHMSTFHSFCLNLLRKHHRAAGLAAGFSLAGTSDQIDLVRRGLEEKNWAGLYQPDALHFQISNAKNYLLSPDEIRDGKGHGLIKEDPSILADVYDLYERQLKLNRVIDFDDCIYKLVRLVQENETIRAQLQKQFHYFLVDEFQDTNQSQLKVLEMLVPQPHNVCAVGDDDQSIYSWRGAMYEVLEKYEAMFPGTALVKLEQNYRCSSSILDAANHVIKNNAIRKDKTLWCASKDKTPITLTPIADDSEEARYVADKIIGLLGAGYKPQDIGILYRANNQAKPLEMALREARISYKTFGGQSFFERKEVKDFLSYVRLILNPADHMALWRVINYPSRGLGLRTLEKIEERSKQTHKPPFTTIKAGELSFTPKINQSLHDFGELISELGSMNLTTKQEVREFGEAIIKLCGLDKDIKAKEKDIGKRASKLENLHELPDWLSCAAEHLIEDEGALHPNTFLDRLSLDRDKKTSEDKNKTFVSLMTIHAAKGLEFPCVFVVGAEEELLPHKNSITSSQGIAEERRLFYVAVTRAKEKLFLSYAQERKGGYNQKSSRMRSRFLGEIPQECLNSPHDEHQAMEKRSERRQKGTLSRLGSLKDKLNSGQWG